MEKLRELLENILNEELYQIVLSGQRKEDSYTKIKIRPLKKKDELIFQAAAWDGKKEFHFNCGREDMTSRILIWMERDFKQLQAETVNGDQFRACQQKGKSHG